MAWLGAREEMRGWRGGALWWRRGGASGGEVAGEGARESKVLLPWIGSVERDATEKNGLGRR